mgnify:CR=1 FL=1|tara:strand:- start:136 stop:366 length:231 start_codon:yes stop_codon:yes gene_type:complete
MEDLVDLIATDASASDVTDKIKDALMAKAAARIDAFKPEVAADVFGDQAPEEEEVVDELENEDETTLEPEEEYEDE